MEGRRLLLPHRWIIGTIFASSLLLISASAQEIDTADPAEILDKIARTYGIEIISNEPQFPVTSGQVTIDGHVADKQLLAQYAKLFAAEFTLYPTGIVKQAHLKRIVLCAKLTGNNKREGGLADIEHDTIYLDITVAGADHVYLREAIHHELFHCIDYHVNGRIGEDSAWEALNPPGFKYERASPAMKDSASGGGVTGRILGFLNSYSTTAVEEDKAVVFSQLMVDPHYVADRKRADHVLRKKVRLLKQSLAAACPEVDEQFWKHALERKRENQRAEDDVTAQLKRVRRRVIKLHAVEFNHDGQRLAAALDNGSAIIWSADGESFGLLLAGHRGPVRCVTFSQDDRYVATGADDKTAVLWDAKTGVQVRVLEGPKRVESVTFSPDGAILATGSYGLATLWDVPTGRKIQSLAGLAGVPVAFTPDGQRLLTVAPNGAVIRWDVRSGERQPAIEPNDRLADSFAPELSVTFSPDRQQIAASPHSPTAICWDSSTSKIPRTIHMDEVVTSLAYAPDGKELAIGFANGSVAIRDASTGDFLKSLTGHRGSIQSVVFSPDGRFILAGSADGVLGVWDRSTGNSQLWLVCLEVGNDWIAMDVRGYYDGTDRGRDILAENAVSRGVLAEERRPIGMLYRPGLLKQIMPVTVAP